MKETITIISGGSAFLYRLSKKLIEIIYMRNLPAGLVEKLKEATTTYIKPSFVYEYPCHYQEPKDVPNVNKGLIRYY